MQQDPDFVIIGRLGSAYGLQGWNHIDSYTAPRDNILGYATWYIAQQGEWKPFTLVEGRTHGKGIVAHLQGINDPQAAGLLTQSYIAVKKEALPPLSEGEYYWGDLEGSTVQTPEGKVLGKIKYLYDNTGTDIMVIQSENGKEHQIPFILHDTVVAVHLAEKIVVVDWVIETT